MPPEFRPGLELSRVLHAESVRPLLRRHFPGLPYSAARLGSGSEVLGFDSERSADHEWGPRLQVFLRPADARAHAAAVAGLLAERLPTSVGGFPTNFDTPVGGPVGVMRVVTAGPVQHRVEVTDLPGWCAVRLGFDPGRGVGLLDWLGAPAQRLAEVTGGAVFHDGLGALRPARARLAWYPDQVWRYLLACQWERVAAEEAFVGRAGEAGDELGSAVVAARLARDLMRLCLLLGRRYPPYSKWLGSAFARLPGTGAAGPALAAAVAATGWRARERHLGAAYLAVAGLHNRLGLTPPLDPATRRYHDRPFQVLAADRFAAALRAGITDPRIAALPPAGAVDQHMDSSDVLSDPRRARRAAAAVLGLRQDDAEPPAGGGLGGEDNRP